MSLSPHPPHPHLSSSNKPRVMIASRRSRATMSAMEAAVLVADREARPEAMSAEATSVVVAAAEVVVATVNMFVSLLFRFLIRHIVVCLFCFMTYTSQHRYLIYFIFLFSCLQFSQVAKRLEL
jgi:hypothetical protein